MLYELQATRFLNWVYLVWDPAPHQWVDSRSQGAGGAAADTTLGRLRNKLMIENVQRVYTLSLIHKWIDLIAKFETYS